MCKSVNEHEMCAIRPAATMKTPDQVRADFRRRGETIAAWARKNQLSAEIVRAVLCGNAKGNYGAAHRAAVLLGLKDGELPQR